jgi:hypothetical protein
MQRHLGPDATATSSSHPVSRRAGTSDGFTAINVAWRMSEVGRYYQFESCRSSHRHRQPPLERPTTAAPRTAVIRGSAGCTAQRPLGASQRKYARRRRSTAHAAQRASKASEATSAWGRVHSVASGCFREAQLQGLLFGDEPGKAAGMSRPTAAGEDYLIALSVRLTYRSSTVLGVNIRAPRKRS